MDCTAPTCTRSATQQTPEGPVCHHHYMLWRLHGHVGSKYPDTCTVDGCTNKHLTQGMCSGHYRRMRVYGSTDPRPRKNARKVCSVDGCDLISFGNGMCMKHHARVRRYGSTDLPPVPVPDPVLCAQCGGPRPSHRWAYCSDECAARAMYHVRRATSHAREMRKYNKTVEWYESTLAAQGGGCAICHSTDPKSGRQHFAVDHDHRCCSGVRSCGKCVRGLLCMPCNSAIGHFNDDLDLLRAAVTYIQEPAV